MNKIIEMVNLEIDSKLITIKKEYQGHVRRMGHDKIIDFQYTLKPSENISSFVIYADDSVLSDAYYGSDDLINSIQNDVKKAVDLLIDRYKKENINIGGVELFISDFIAHDIDYRVHFFLANFLEEFITLFNQKGLKILNKNQYRIAEQQYDPIVQSTYNYEEDSIRFKTCHFQIAYKNRFLRLSTELVESINFSYYDGYSDEPQLYLTFTILPLNYHYKRNENITVKCQFDKQHIEISSCINNALKDFMVELENDNIHLGSLNIDFDFKIIPQQSENSSDFISDKIYRYTSLIHWKFKEIFMKYGAIYE